MLKGHLINKNYNLLNCLYLTFFKIARKVHLPFNLCRISYQTQNSCMSVIDNWNQDDAKIILYLFSLDMFLSCMSIMRKIEEKTPNFLWNLFGPFYEHFACIAWSAGFICREFKPRRSSSIYYSEFSCAVHFSFISTIQVYFLKDYIGDCIR